MKLILKNIHKMLFCFLIIAVFGCKNSTKEETLSLTTEELIDEKVTAILDTSKIYEIAFSMRFSKENESYQTVNYSINDTLYLIIEDIIKGNIELEREIYFENGEPIFIIEYGVEYVFDDSVKYFTNKIYFHEGKIHKGYENISFIENEFNENITFEEKEFNISDFDFKKGDRAVKQEGEFEMKFDQFLIIEPQSYLILDNKESGYSVALFIMEADDFLNELFENQDLYKGRTIYPKFEFITMNKINRMVYRGVY